MEGKILNGKEIAKKIREEIKKEVEDLKRRYGVTPGLVTILVGKDPASLSYVTSKQKVAQELGFYSVDERLPEDISERDLLRIIEKYNLSSEIHGILVQLPLPKHIDEKKIIYSIDPKKDVDGFHPYNMGRLLIGDPTFIPCTPYGIVIMLKEAGVKVEGSEVVILGRSNIVGKPLAVLLMQKFNMTGNATVTICHTKTRDLIFHTKRADILIVAIGQPRFIKEDMIKKGAVIIDVGVNKIGTTPDGKNILCGDVDFERVKEKASLITPVPGGVGPMTITMLMKNTLEAAKVSLGISETIKF